MVDLLIQTLEPLDYTIRQQGSFLAEEKYPDHFFTYWNDSSDGEGFYDNEEGAIIWQYSLNFYSIDPAKVDSVLLEAKELLKKAGFVANGAGYAVMSDEPTHTGRAITILYRQKV